ncbi:MAG TPA: hypothetical protein VK470_00425 [Bacteroidota bacterium]|nr:hypothetical protein [Bacteroidota bacterium]
MGTDKTKLIILIENQVTQFIQIKKHLNNYGYLVYPNIADENINKSDIDGEFDADKTLRNISEYKHFMDLIRIYLSERYGGLEPDSKRNVAFKNILDIIAVKKPALLIIDHILVGFHNAMNGIHLAIALRDAGITIPILFLSRTDANDIEVVNNLQNCIEPKLWVHKGYSGRKIFEDKYFKIVVAAIDKLIIGVQNKSVKNKIGEIIKSISGNQKAVLLYNELTQLFGMNENQFSDGISEAIMNYSIHQQDENTQEGLLRLLNNRPK